jgi:hypothetical protein
MPHSCMTSYRSDANTTDPTEVIDQPINSELNSSDILHPLEHMSMVYKIKTYLYL